MKISDITIQMAMYILVCLGLDIWCIAENNTSYTISFTIFLISFIGLFFFFLIMDIKTYFKNKKHDRK